ncbi:MAG: hypothetical protein P1P84_05660 [Deferrisomatales bacterium]|nr:hypothetical protein [Deferrisomatales bacterium]
MAFNFTPERPALNFGPRHHARWSSRQFLLWPAWAYRVVAPRVRQRKLNLLQRAVMGLCRVGVRRADVIADHLSVHTDLAAFIITELRDLGHLDEHGLPTEGGLRVLEEDALETQEMVAGYVFQDPWNGDLWPRFVEALDYCELEFNEGGFPSILLGPTGRPRRHRAFTVLPRSETTPATPTASAVVQAVARHRKGLRFKDADDSEDESLGSFVASGVQISRVSFVEEKPQPIFLMTYLYVPESDAGAMDWYACDPFGLGQSVRLRRRLEAVMHDVPGLFGVIDHLVGETLHAGYEDQQRWLEAIHLQAGLAIDHRMTVNLRNHSAFDQFVAMESARLEMRSLGPECPERKINEVLRAGVKVLEVVFSSLAVTRPLGDIWKRVYVPKIDRWTGTQRLVQQQDRSVLAAIYEGAFHSLGFAAPIPNSLLNVRPGHIRSVAEYQDNWRLRPLVTATALLAQRDPTHPFAGAARTSPGLLVTLEEVASAGGAAGHADGGSVSPDAAEQHVEKIYDIVSLLLGLTSTESESSIESTGESHG